MMNIALKEPSFDEFAQRRVLKNAIAIRLACSRDVDQIGVTIADAERRIAKMREELSGFTTLLNSAADFASEALRNGSELSPPADLIAAKKKHEHLLEKITFAESGLLSLKAQLSQKENDLVVLSLRVNEAVEPLVCDTGEQLAEEVFRLELAAGAARAKLRALSMSGQNGRVQKLGVLAYRILKNLPENAREIQINTPLFLKEQHCKKAIIDWRKCLEVDSNAKLNLDDDNQQK
ncbi:MAG TPA: hypothetical protein VIE65_19410 [Methylobacter sp.]